MQSLYRGFWEAGVTVDVLSPNADLTSYRLLVVPSLFMINQSAAAAIDEFVSAGGAAIVTYMSGIVDENLHVFEGAYPGALRDVLGLRVEEFFPLLRRGRLGGADPV